MTKIFVEHECFWFNNVETLDLACRVKHKASGFTRIWTLSRLHLMWARFCSGKARDDLGHYRGIKTYADF
jgi:hypothetical protein